jgi:hypothetical protein
MKSDFVNSDRDLEKGFLITEFILIMMLLYLFIPKKVYIFAVFIFIIFFHLVVDYCRRRE